MPTADKLQQARADIDQAAANAGSADELMKSIVERLHARSGAAASSGKTVVVDDVNSDPRYLACSTETKSEIVVPVFVNGKVVGELDIDSHFPAAFSAEDRQLVEHCAALVGKRLEQPSR